MKAFASIRIPLALLGTLTLTAGLGVAWAPGAAQAAEGRASEGAPARQAGVAQLNEEGAALYAARDYRRAIEKFIQAYAIDTDPNLLFNIARCYEELGDADAAIEKYETFLKTPGADARGRQRARESLAALREARDNPDPAPEPSPASARPVVAVEQSSAAPRAEEAADGSSSAVPWLVLGGSAAFAVAGTAFYLMGASDHDQVTEARGYGDRAVVTDLTRREADDLVSSGDTKKLIGGISFGLAGALAATYVVLLASGDDEGPGETGPSLGFSVVPSPDGTAVMAQGSF